jgi:outer membrane lipoprotein SlyB
MMLRSIYIFGLLGFLIGCVEQQPVVENGTVVQVEPADAPAENTGFGGVGGAAAGGIIGSQIGGGAGQIAATVVGVIAGAAAGTATEGALQNASGLRYTVRLDDGRVMTIVQHRESEDRVIQPGERVVIHTSGWRQRVEPVTGPPSASRDPAYGRSRSVTARADALADEVARLGDAGVALEVTL